MSRLILLHALLLMLPLAGGGAISQPDPLRVGAAISLQNVLQEIAAKYKQQTGRNVTFTFGSSGQLMGQIRNGAPIDLFISAAHQQVDQLAGEKLIAESSRRVVATNTLVLIVPADARDPPAGFKELAEARVRRLAMGEPRTVPAGQYAQQVLDHLKLADSLRDRIIYGSNVRQVLAYVERGEVDAGIVYRTDAIESGEKVRVIATAEPAWHSPIEYPAAIVTGTKQKESAALFLDFLRSEAAAAVLESHGFGVPGTAPVTKPAAD